MRARALNPFLREHAAPLAGSAALHALIAAALLVAAWFTVVPKVTPPAAIEAYLVGLPQPAPAPAAAVAAVPAPETTPAPVSAPQPTASEPAAAAPPAEMRADVDRATAERARAAAAHDRAVVAAGAEKADARRRAATALKQQQALAARRQAETQAAQRAAAAATEQARRQAASADAAQRSLRESDLARRLAAEQQRFGAENTGLLNRYVAEIQARIERAWNRPPSARVGLRCLVDVVQVPGGTVTEVRIGECNGDAAVQESVKVAVFRASPLPAPPDPSLFERNLRLVFAPDG